MNDQKFYIDQVTRVSEETLTALNNLMRQLNPDIRSLTLNDLQKIIDVPNTYLFVAKAEENDAIVGTLTLVTYSTPSATRGYIEDVVVDEVYRGNGLGEKLMYAGIGKARELGLTYIGLTSRPEREAANHLYQRLGFKKRNTNVYRLMIDTLI